MIPLSGDLPKSKGIKSENVESVNVTKGTSTLKRGFAHMLKNGVEYATVGVLASIIGVGLSSGLSWAVMKYLIKAPWHPRFDVMLWTLVLSIFLTTFTGIISSMDVLKNKPLKTLREVDG